MQSNSLPKAPDKRKNVPRETDILNAAKVAQRLGLVQNNNVASLAAVLEAVLFLGATADNLTKNGIRKK